MLVFGWRRGRAVVDDRKREIAYRKVERGAPIELVFQQLDLAEVGGAAVRHVPKPGGRSLGQHTGIHPTGRAANLDAVSLRAVLVRAPLPMDGQTVVAQYLRAESPVDIGGQATAFRSEREVGSKRGEDASRSEQIAHNEADPVDIVRTPVVEDAAAVQLRIATPRWHGRPHGRRCGHPSCAE